MSPTLFPESLASVSVPCFRRFKNRKRTTGLDAFPEAYGNVTRGLVMFATVTVLLLLLYYVAGFAVGFLISPSRLDHHNKAFPPLIGNDPKLEKILKAAATTARTVVLTISNEAWAAPDSVVDLFLESLRIGDDTVKLLKHLVVVALDEKAYNRCLQVHTYCYALYTEGIDDAQGEAYYMSPTFLKIAWKRIDFLRSVLEMGYNFVFTDADVMWLRDPFPRFYPNVDFQISCDHYMGEPDDLWLNSPNTGFEFVRSNNRTIELYKYWYSQREQFPGYKEQDVFNIIKTDDFVGGLGLDLRFLDTAYFGGFCEPSKDLNLACTMHANCCFGLDTKLHDLRILLQDWKSFMALEPSSRRSSGLGWRVPQNCSVEEPSGKSSNE